jgi:hypothetical protein
MGGNDVPPNGLIISQHEVKAFHDGRLQKIERLSKRRGKPGRGSPQPGWIIMFKVKALEPVIRIMIDVGGFWLVIVVFDREREGTPEIIVVEAFIGNTVAIDIVFVQLNALVLVLFVHGFTGIEGDGNNLVLV